MCWERTTASASAACWSQMGLTMHPPRWHGSALSDMLSSGYTVSPTLPLSKIRRESQGDLGGQPTSWGSFVNYQVNYSRITVGDLNMPLSPPPHPPFFFLLWDIKGVSWSAWEQRSYSRNLSTATLSTAFTVLGFLPVVGNSTCSLCYHYC